MQQRDDKPLFAGGFLILAGFLAGAFFGIRQGEPSIGAIIGTLAGALAALVLWLTKRSSRA